MEDMACVAVLKTFNRQRMANVIDGKKGECGVNAACLCLMDEASRHAECRVSLTFMDPCTHPLHVRRCTSSEPPPQMAKLRFFFNRVIKLHFSLARSPDTLECKVQGLIASMRHDKKKVTVLGGNRHQTLFIRHILFHLHYMEPTEGHGDGTPYPGLG